MSEAKIDALAEALGRHLFLEGWTNPIGVVPADSDNARCTCGHEYDNPNASAGYSHPRHVAAALVADGWSRDRTSEAVRERHSGRVQNLDGDWLCSCGAFLCPSGDDRLERSHGQHVETVLERSIRPGQTA